MSNNNEKSIEALVEALPEVYQPIYNHSEFTAQASRTCLDRLEIITAAYDYISEQKGRPLKVLDLGCAQGFFSLNLASRGAKVTAVDYSQPNIDVCKKLLSESEGFNVEFLLGSIEIIVKDKIQPQEYDMVLGLSVFHHIVYEHGVDFVLDLFKIITNKIETGIFEFALNSEPLYWAECQHPDPRAFIDFFNYQHQISMFGTHLSSVERPLFFASNTYWNIGNEYGVIDSFSRRSHQLDMLYHNNNRRYYFSGDNIIKIFINRTDYDNWTELNEEYKFLQSPIEGYRAPKLVNYGSNNGESWLVRKVMPGELLLNIIMDGRNYDDEHVIEQVLQQLSLLEEKSLYHNDLRPWNLLLTEDGEISIIDYGSISNLILDGDDLYGQMLSLFVLLREIASHKVRNTHSVRPDFISPTDFPNKYQNWLNSVWSLPSAQWNCQVIYEKYIEHKRGGNLDYQSVATSNIIEGYLTTVSNHLRWQIKAVVDNAFDRIEVLTENNQKQEKIINELKDESISIHRAYDQKIELFAKQIENNNILLMSSIQDLIKKDNNHLSELIKLQIESGTHLLNDSLKNHVQESIINNSSAQAMESYDVKLTNISEELMHCNNYAYSLRKELDGVYASRSWKVTYPVRILSKFVGTILSPSKLKNAVKYRCKKKSKTLIKKVSNFILNSPYLKHRAMLIINKHPALKFKIKGILVSDNMVFNPQPSSINQSMVHGAGGCNESGKTNVVDAFYPDRGYKTQGTHESQKSVLESWFY